MRPISFLALFALACKPATDLSDATVPDPPDPVPSDPGTGDTMDPTPKTTDQTTFYQDVLPVVDQYCGACHDGSGIGPGDLTSYTDASVLGASMLYRIDAGDMPPPAADPDCHDYQGDEWMVMPEAARDVIAAWVEDGKPEGDPANPAPLSGLGPVSLSRVDQELQPPAPYVPQFTDGNEYRCFLVDEVDADTYISGFEFLMDNASMSHHAVLFVDPNGGNQSLIQDPATQSWNCPEVIPRPEWSTIHAWAPSGGALEFPDGMGLKVDRGDQIILQMHYWDGGQKAVPDHPKYALKLEPKVQREVIYFPTGPQDFTIPAGDAAFTANQIIPMFFLTFGQFEFDVWGIFPHMHVLGTGFEVKSTNDVGEACISRADAYDFDLQPTYWFDSPVRVGATDLLSVSCTWDNSAANPNQLNDPPVDVEYGENTQQEMCFALMYVEQIPVE